MGFHCGILPAIAVRSTKSRPTEPWVLEFDSVELVPFASITAADVRRSGEPNREALRSRGAHAGPISDDTLLYRVEFHVLSGE